jgi:hypothetical protein
MKTDDMRTRRYSLPTHRELILSKERERGGGEGGTGRQDFAKGTTLLLLVVVVVVVVVAASKARDRKMYRFRRFICSASRPSGKGRQAAR